MEINLDIYTRSIVNGTLNINDMHEHNGGIKLNRAKCNNFPKLGIKRQINCNFMPCIKMPKVLTIIPLERKGQHLILITH